VDRTEGPVYQAIIGKDFRVLTLSPSMLANVHPKYLVDEIGTPPQEDKNGGD